MLRTAVDLWLQITTWEEAVRRVSGKFRPDVNAFLPVTNKREHVRTGEEVIAALLFFYGSYIVAKYIVLNYVSSEEKQK